MPRLPLRALDAHKGTLGTVAVWAGSRGMAGAAILACTAALRSGAGLVRAVVPEDLQPVLAAACPCATSVGLPAGRGRAEAAAGRVLEGLLAGGGVEAWVVGPGLGTGETVRRLLARFLPRCTAPVVLDADGLNHLGRELELVALRAAPTVLTPHPGEAARLLATTAAEVQHDRPAAALALARRSGAVVVLKGACTLVTDGQRWFRNTTGNPGMATGGTGDVLSGMLGALLASRMDPLEAAVLGVHAHGLAGDQAVRTRSWTGLIASDLLEALPTVWRGFEGATGR